MWYLWDKKDNHGKQTLALANLNSQHDQEELMASDEMDCEILSDKGD